MRELEKTKTSILELGFLVFSSTLLKYSTYPEEIGNWRITMGSLIATGIAA
jgi:hypothetical protein